MKKALLAAAALIALPAAANAQSSSQSIDSAEIRKHPAAYLDRLLRSNRSMALSSDRPNGMQGLFTRWPGARGRLRQMLDSLLLADRSLGELAGDSSCPGVALRTMHPQRWEESGYAFDRAAEDA